MHDHDDNDAKLYGLIGEFDDPDAVLAAAKVAYSEGYRKMEAYSPFPIHGLAEAIGFTHNYVPLVGLIAGLTGAVSMFGMQWFACVVHYPYNIGGRPDFSWPAFIPITFEGMVLFSAWSIGISMLLFNGFPRPHHPVMDAKNFKRASSDRFFLCIEADDSHYGDAQKFFDGLEHKPLDVSEVIS